MDVPMLFTILTWISLVAFVAIAVTITLDIDPPEPVYVEDDQLEM